jgi:hypothetical protein
MTRFDLGSMRQTAGAGGRVSSHTRPPPVATEIGDSGKPIRATIAALLRGGDDLPVGPGGADEAPARSGRTAGVLVLQPDAAAATTTARAAASLNQVGARTLGTRIPLLRPTCLLGSSLGQRASAGITGGPVAGLAWGASRSAVTVGDAAARRPSCRCWRCGWRVRRRPGAGVTRLHGVPVAASQALGRRLAAGLRG